MDARPMKKKIQARLDELYRRRDPDAMACRPLPKQETAELPESEQYYRRQAFYLLRQSIHQTLTHEEQMRRYKPRIPLAHPNQQPQMMARLERDEAQAKLSHEQHIQCLRLALAGQPLVQAPEGTSMEAWIAMSFEERRDQIALRKESDQLLRQSKKRRHDSFGQEDVEYFCEGQSDISPFRIRSQQMQSDPRHPVRPQGNDDQAELEKEAAVIPEEASASKRSIALPVHGPAASSSRTAAEAQPIPNASIRTKQGFGASMNPHSSAPSRSNAPIPIVVPTNPPFKTTRPPPPPMFRAGRIPVTTTFPKRLSSRDNHEAPAEPLSETRPAKRRKFGDDSSQPTGPDPDHIAERPKKNSLKKQPSQYTFRAAAYMAKALNNLDTASPRLPVRDIVKKAHSSASIHHLSETLLGKILDLAYVSKDALPVTSKLYWRTHRHQANTSSTWNGNYLDNTTVCKAWHRRAVDMVYEKTYFAFDDSLKFYEFATNHYTEHLAKYRASPAYVDHILRLEIRVDSAHPTLLLDTIKLFPKLDKLRLIFTRDFFSPGPNDTQPKSLLKDVWKIEDFKGLTGPKLLLTELREVSSVTSRATVMDWTTRVDDSEKDRFRRNFAVFSERMQKKAALSYKKEKQRIFVPMPSMTFDHKMPKASFLFNEDVQTQAQPATRAPPRTVAPMEIDSSDDDLSDEDIPENKAEFFRMCQEQPEALRRWAMKKKKTVVDLTADD